jgi:hypothetical protein
MITSPGNPTQAPLFLRCTELLPVARAYWDAGLCPLPRLAETPEPCFVDASGTVHALRWGEYKVKQPDWPTVARWFQFSSLQTTGVLLLPGSHAHPRADTSAFLQILDIESPEIWTVFKEDLLFSGHADILHRCVIERTPSRGVHLGFWCPAIGDTQKQALARRRDDHKILLELLQHQPCTVAPTSIHCKPEHPPGAAYSLEQGDWRQPYAISPAQRQVLLEAARALNEVPEKLPHASTGSGAEDRPGDRLNAHADLDWWTALLTRHGWRDVSRPGLQRAGIAYFQRPGKFGKQPSATYGKTGQCLYVFSSNAQPFLPDTAYTPFHALVVLEYDGDFTQAARALIPSPAAPGHARRGVSTGLRPVTTTLRRRIAQ